MKPIIRRSRLRAFFAGLLILSLLFSACSESTAPVPGATSAAAETAPAKTAPAESTDAAATAGSTEPDVPTDPAADASTAPALTEGTPLYLALNDARLENVKTAPPVSVAVSIGGNDGTTAVQTANQDVIGTLVSRFTEITVGAQTETVTAPGDRSVLFAWEDGSATVLRLGEENLELPDGGGTRFYALENTAAFWDYAARLPEALNDEEEEFSHVVCDEQKFSTSAFPGSYVDWVDGEGLYIALTKARTVPYVLIYRHANAGVTAQDYLTDTVVPSMKDRYGADLLETGELQSAEISDSQTMYFIRFAYRAGGNILYSMRAAISFGNDVVSFNGKYTENYEDDTLDALELAIADFSIDGPLAKEEPAQPETPQSGEKDASAVRLVEYSDPWVTMMIPEGWTVDVGLGSMDFFMYHAVTAYDPADPNCRLFFNLKTDGYMATQAMRDWMKACYPKSMFAVLPAIAPATLENFYDHATDGWNWYYGASMHVPQISDFTVKQKLGQSLLGGDVVYASCTGEDGAALSGIFTASLHTFDLGYVQSVAAYQTVFFTLPEEKMADWGPLLNECLISFAYTQDFVDAYARSADSAMQTFRANQAAYDQMSDMIMQRWNDLMFGN